MNIALLYAIIVLLSLLVIALFVSYLKAQWIKWGQQRKMKHGRNAEKKALKLLSSYGFKQIEYQKKVTYTLRIDGKSKVITITPDIIAVYKGASCVIEVKTGKNAVSVQNEHTRRQLLEYRHALQPDRLFLLDIDRKNLMEIDFDAR